MKTTKIRKLQLTLKFKELDHFSVVRNGNVQFPCEIRCLRFSWRSSQDAMMHSGYISALDSAVGSAITYPLDSDLSG